MSDEEFTTHVKEMIDRCVGLLADKQSEYSDHVDRLHCFRNAAQIHNEPMRKALAGMMAKHTVSIYDMCNSGKDYDVDKWFEKNCRQHKLSTYSVDNCA